MLTTARDRMAKLIKDGKSEADVVAAKPFADLDKTGRQRSGQHKLHPRGLSLAGGQARRQDGKRGALNPTAQRRQ